MKVIFRQVTSPIRSAINETSPSTLRADFVAGLTVAVVAVPQSMAYAAIAGVPLQYGIYTVIFQSIIGGIFASQRFLSVGPINTQSLLVASTVTLAMRHIGPLDQEEASALYLQLVLALTIIKGIMQLGMAGLRLGALAKYVSSAVVIGFTAGAAVLIAAGQIGNFLGVSSDARSASDWPGIVGTIQRLLPHIHELKPWSLGLGLAALTIVLVAKQISRWIPGPLIAVIATAACVKLIALSSVDVKLVDAIPTGIDQFGLVVPWAGLEYWELLFGGAIALSLLGLLEAYSIGKSLAAKSGGRVSANQELFGQGLTNTFTGFFQCIPGSGSFSRSALNQFAGAKTCFSSVFNGIFVLVIFLIGAGYAKYIPMSALAAILFVIVYGLIDWKHMLRLYRTSRADAAVCFGTFASTLVLPLSYAVFVGVFLNIALYVRRTSRLHINEMVASGPDNSMFFERPLDKKPGSKQVIFLQIAGDLFFGLADELQDRLASIEQSRPSVVIFRLKRTHSIDSTILAVLEQFTQAIQTRGGHVILCGMHSYVTDKVRGYGLEEIIGSENVFEAQQGIFTSSKLALRRAAELVHQSIDENGLDLQEYEDDELKKNQRSDQ